MGLIDALVASPPTTPECEGFALFGMTRCEFDIAMATNLNWLQW